MTEDQRAKVWRQIKAAERDFFLSLQFFEHQVYSAQHKLLICRIRTWLAITLLALAIFLFYFYSK